MPRYQFVVFTAPMPNEEEEYNRWYDEVHLPDVVKLPGYVSAQRFRFRPTAAAAEMPQPYMAIYTVETDDLDATDQLLRQTSGSAAMVMSDALDRDSILSGYFEPLGPPRNKPE